MRRIAFFTLLATALLARAAPVIPGLAHHATIDPATAGEILVEELNCAACHEAGPAERKGAPDLSKAGSRLRGLWIQRFIANPHSEKPGTTMPDVLGHLNDAEKQDASFAIAHYLGSLSPERPPSAKADPEAATRGDTLYHTVGCVACHSPKKGTPLPHSVPFAKLEEKYTIASLVEFLENPLETRRGGRMPDMGLSHWEATDIANFLIGVDPPPEPAFIADPGLIAKGKRLYEEFRCSQCHDANPEAAVNRIPLSPSEKGCLSGKPGIWPDYRLDADQRQSIRSALAVDEPTSSRKSQIEKTLTRFNCIACHDRDGYGGIADERRAFFGTTNVNLGEQASVPPSLDLVGAKLKPEALRKILVLGHASSVRPYMNARMPKFGKENVAHLTALFAEADRLEPIAFDRIKDQKLARNTGLELAGEKGLACVSCHMWDGKSATTLRGLDLTAMHPRLEETWFHHYLVHPQRFHPQTIMPTYWPAGKSVRPEFLDGNTRQQIDALWQYLARGRQARQPRGIKRDPLPLRVTGDKAVMLRRNYRGIGKRGIGVGYPAGINLSFDAGQMRLGSLWRGDFAEASAVWYGQGSGHVHEGSREVIRFPEGPAFALLPTPESPWPFAESKKAEGFQFKGYTLDKKRRPTFRYEFLNPSRIRIQDYFLDHGEPAHFKRTLTFHPDSFPLEQLQIDPHRGLYFRAAADKGVDKLPDGSYKIGKLLQLRVPSKAFVRDGGAGVKEVLVPVFDGSDLVIEYHWLP